MAEQEQPIIVRTARELEAAAEPWRKAGEPIALVPTMGALHRAHMALIVRAQELAKRTVVSIFVNPKQFAPGEDFAHYPRSEETDLEKLREARVDLAYVPPEEEIYPADFSANLSAGPLAEVLCGKSRPGHFNGVVTVVGELFRQARPEIAIFGEKDFQQLRIIERMVDERDIPVEIAAVPLVRDPDGLATSSRNEYLSDGERRRALNLPGTLTVLMARAAEGEELRNLETAGTGALTEAGLEVEYLEFRHEHNLERAEDLFRPVRLFAAVRIGSTRLIDNMPVPGG